MQTLSMVEGEERTVFSQGMLRCIGHYFLWYTWDEHTRGKSISETVVSILDWKSTQFKNFCHTLCMVVQTHNGDKGCGNDRAHTYLPHLHNTCLPHVWEECRVQGVYRRKRDKLESIHRGKRTFLVYQQLKIARVWSVLCVVSTVDDLTSQSLERPFGMTYLVSRLHDTALVKHSQSESHIKATKMEAAIGSAWTDWGIEMALKWVFRDKYNMLALLWV